MRNTDRKTAPKTSFFLILLCSLLAISSFSTLLSTLYFNQANLFLADWAKNEQPPSAPALNIAQNAVVRAISLHPKPLASYFAALGRIEEWRHYHLAADDMTARKSRQYSLKAYRKAAELNPNWAAHWLDIASVKIRLGEFDDELAKAMETAGTLAPYRPNTTVRLIEIGFMQWNKLPASAQLAVKEAIKRASNSDRRVTKKVFHTTQRLNQTNLLCSLDLGPSIDPANSFEHFCR